jgi:hypothetical protein
VRRLIELVEKPTGDIGGIDVKSIGSYSRKG